MLGLGLCKFVARTDSNTVTFSIKSGKKTHLQSALLCALVFAALPATRRVDGTALQLCACYTIVQRRSNSRPAQKDTAAQRCHAQHRHMRRIARQEARKGEAKNTVKAFKLFRMQAINGHKATSVAVPLLVPPCTNQVASVKLFLSPAMLSCRICRPQGRTARPSSGCTGLPSL